MKAKPLASVASVIEPEVSIFVDPDSIVPLPFKS